MVKFLTQQVKTMNEHGRQENKAVPDADVYEFGVDTEKDARHPFVDLTERRKSFRTWLMNDFKRWHDECGRQKRKITDDEEQRIRKLYKNYEKMKTLSKNDNEK
ncbi:uncharacterized protein [Ptychodera flava]|uniref:uncharacterized protein isoform X2 n=1 Tax=Ptychodera flava TaxID=63121 RepID=UPI00396A0BC0